MELLISTGVNIMCSKKAKKRMEIIEYQGIWCREVENMEYALAAVNFALCEHKGLTKPVKKFRKACKALEQYVESGKHLEPIEEDYED